MSLRYKILLILIAVVGLYAGLDYGVQRLAVFPSFVALEKKEATKDIERCFEAIRRELYHLDTFNHDWAAWDDTYAFVQDRNAEYISSNLVAETFIDNRLNLIYLCDKKGHVVWGEIRNVETWQKMDLHDFPPTALPLEHPLLSHNSVDSRISGVFSTDFKPMLVSSRPIVTTNNKGPIQGTLIMGRFLDDAYVRTLAEQTHVDFYLWPIAGNALPEEEREVLPRITQKEPIYIGATHEDHLHVYGTFPDIHGSPVLLVRANISQEITAKGKTALQFAFFSILAVGAIILFVLFVLLRKTVLTPIETLTAHAVSIGKSDNLAPRLSFQRTDEIGVLAQKFDDMMQQLSQARSRHLELSYRAGVAEMAAGVHHNIRNTLSPLIVDLRIMQEELRKLPLEKIQQAFDELTGKKVSREREKDLLRFLEITCKNFTTFVEKLEVRMENLAGRAAHVEEILPRKEAFDVSSKPVEKVDMKDLVCDAMDLMPDYLKKVIILNFHASIKALNPIWAQRVPLRQVLMNILNNAAESIQKTGAATGTIDVDVMEGPDSGTGLIHLTLCDTGEGIAPEDLDHVFEKGYTTKKQGAWGIGLHWCANTMAAMGGRLSVESKGMGSGACFHLYLPVQ